MLDADLVEWAVALSFVGFAIAIIAAMVGVFLGDSNVYDD